MKVKGRIQTKISKARNRAGHVVGSCAVPVNRDTELGWWGRFVFWHTDNMETLCGIWVPSYYVPAITITLIVIGASALFEWFLFLGRLSVSCP
jgi:hypothetical protein